MRTEPTLGNPSLFTFKHMRQECAEGVAGSKSKPELWDDLHCWPDATGTPLYFVLLFHGRRQSVPPNYSRTLSVGEVHPQKCLQ